MDYEAEREDSANKNSSLLSYMLLSHNYVGEAYKGKMEEQGAIARSGTGGEVMGSQCSECPRRYEDETDELKVMRPVQCDWMSGP